MTLIRDPKKHGLLRRRKDKWLAVALAFWAGVIVAIIMLGTELAKGRHKDPGLTRADWTRKAREATPREPLPTYITWCESKNNLRAHNPSGAGGRYQIMPATWRSQLPSQRFIWAAGGDRGPRWSSRLLQDKVAANLRAEYGLGQWSCA